MNSITNKEAMNLVHRLHADGHLIWNYRGKVILALPDCTVSVKNRIELIRALYEHSYLQADETLNEEALRHFRLAAEDVMLDLAEWFDRSGNVSAKAELANNSHNINGIKNLIAKHVNGLTHAVDAATSRTI